MAINLFSNQGQYADTAIGRWLQSLASYARNKPIEWPEQILGGVSQWLGNLATSVKNAGYSDGSDEKRRQFVSDMLSKGFAKDAILTAMDKLDKQGAFQGGISQNPITGTLASVVSAPLQAASTLAKGESDIASGATKAFSGDYSGAAARYGKGALESTFGATGLATGFTPGGAAVNTALSSETVAKPLQKYVVEPTMAGTQWAQNALGYDTGSQASQDVREIAGMAWPMAALGLGQKYVAPAVESAGKSLFETAKSAKAPSISGSEKLTRTLPVNTIMNELKMTPTERKKVQSITGMNPAEYVLSKGIASASKEDLAAHFDQQAIDAFRSVNEQLSPISTRVKSSFAKDAISDMVEQMESSPKLKRAYANDIAYLKTLAEQPDYSPVELNNIRRAFDKVNTGMYTASGKIRSGLDNSVDVNIREGISSEIENAAQQAGFSVKDINKELRAGLVMKDAMLRSLSQEQKNNMIGLQDIGIMGVFSGGDPLTAISLWIAKRWLEWVRPAIAQKLYDLNKNAPSQVPADFGNTVPARNGASVIARPDSMVAVPPQVEPKTKTVDFTNLKPVPPKVSIKKEVIKANAQRAKKKNVVSLKDEVKEAKLTNQSENATKQPLRNASDDTVGASIVKPADKTLKWGFLNRGGYAKLPDMEISKVQKLNTGKDITLVRWTGKQMDEATSAYSQAYGDGTYLSDDVKIADYYWPKREYVTIKNSDLFDAENDFLKPSEIKSVISEAEKMTWRSMSPVSQKTTYDKLRRDIYGELWLDDQEVSKLINSVLKKRGLKWIRYDIGRVNDDLKWNAFVIFK